MKARPLALVAVAVVLGCLAGSASAAPLILYKAHRHGLLVKLWVQGHRIVGRETGSIEVCQEGNKTAGSITISESMAVPIGRDGHFRWRSSEAEEGAGWSFAALAGTVHGDHIWGAYRGWEEFSGGEEGWSVVCGTHEPRGKQPFYFRAHRVYGPPWHF